MDRVGYNVHRRRYKSHDSNEEQQQEYKVDEEDYLEQVPLAEMETITITTTMNPKLQREMMRPGGHHRRPLLFREIRFLVCLLFLGSGCLAGIYIKSNKSSILRDAAIQEATSMMSIITAGSISISTDEDSRIGRRMLNTEEEHGSGSGGAGTTTNNNNTTTNSTTTFYENVIRKADKDELMKRLHALGDDETRQDVIVNVFTPVEPRILDDVHDCSSNSTWNNALNSITCTTQGGVNKLDRLLHLTSRWRGPVSFAALVSHERDLDLLFEFWHDHALVQDYVTLHILMELPQLTTRPYVNGRYPINQLRNLALHNVQTDYVFVADVDFIPSDHAHDEIAAIIKNSGSSTPSLPPKTFWVLPAFERYKNAVNLALPEEDVTDVNLVPKTKAELIKAIQKDKVVTTFHHFFSVPHAPTNYEKWYTYNETDMYPVEYKKWFEPYVVCKTLDLHDFFPAFRGYGRNKNTFFVEASIRNFSYFVLTNQFVVHMNHQRPYKRGQQDRSHLPPMIAAFLKYVKNKYDMPDEEHHYF